MPGRIVPVSGGVMTRPSAKDEEQVHAPQFFDPAAFDGIEKHHLVVARRHRLGLGHERGGVIAAGLRLSRTSGRGADMIARDMDRHRRRAGLEIPADRRGDHAEAVLLRRTHAEERLGRDHERPQIERAAIDRRHPAGIGQHQFAQRLDEHRFGQFGHRHPGGRAVESRGIRVGAEHRQPAIGGAIGLHALENLLRVMQHGAGRIERQRPARFEPCVVPAAPLVPVDRDHVVREDLAEAGIGDRLVARFTRYRGGVGDAGDVHRPAG